MYHKFQIIFVLALLAKGVSAQTEISGNITDRNGEPLTGVNSVAMNQQDSLYMTETCSDSSSAFSILLSAVTIEGKQSPVKFEAGKTTVNIASTILASQGSAWDAFKLLPGVFVKDDGSIILNGQAGANVLINGKMTYLSGENLMSLLKSMPASSVDKIELITNLSAQYDASGKTGIINIKLIKNPYLGTSGSVYANYKYGEYGRGYGSGRFSFRNDKFSFSASVSRYQGDSKNTLTIFREYLPYNSQNNEKNLMNQHNITKYEDANNYFRINTDYDIAKHITIGGYFFGILNNRIMPGDNRTEFSLSRQKLDSTLFTSSVSKINQKTYSGGIFSEYKDDSHREVNFSADYMFYGNRSTIDMDSKLVQLVNSRMINDSLKGDLSGNINIFAVQGNFSSPVRDHSTLKAGFKSSWVQVENETDYRNKQDADWQADLLSNNQNNYSENINALYLQWESKINVWRLNAGIRMENTIINASYFPDDAAQPDSSYNRNYTNLFPNVMLQYDFEDDKNILSLSYNKRITRPNYRDMLPFNQIWDKYTIACGNANLKPEMTDMIEFSHIYRKILRTTLLFAKINGAISPNYRIEGNNTVYAFPDNISSREGLGIRLETQNFLPVKWWQQGINISFLHVNSSWTEFGEQKKTGLFNIGLNTNHQFLFGKGWIAEIYGYYNSKMTVAQTTTRPFGGVYLGIAKKIFKNNASVRIFAEDIFLTQHENLSINSHFLNAGTSSINDSRTIGIAFSYNFKHGDDRRKMSNETTLDESKRVNL